MIGCAAWEPDRKGADRGGEEVRTHFGGGFLNHVSGYRIARGVWMSEILEQRFSSTWGVK